MISRRTLCVGGLLSPMMAWAHEGHGAGDVWATVLSTDSCAGKSTLALALENRGRAEIVLEPLHTDLGPAEAAVLPLPLAPNARRTVQAELAVAALPGIFTLVLDFGADGAGPLSVIAK